MVRGCRAYALPIRPGLPVAEEAAKARSVLRAAGIPAHIVTKPAEEWEENWPLHEYCVMVPGALHLHAASVLDQAIFSPMEEATLRIHLEALTDEQIRALDPNIFCAGLLDRAARLKSAYNDEVAKRGLKTGTRRESNR